MLYEILFRGWYESNVRYLIVGAVAINLHGIPRMTADLDLMVDLDEANLRRFVETILGLGYRPRVPVQPFELLDSSMRREWQDTKSMVVFTWIHPARPYEEIDHFLENPIEFQAAFDRKKTLKVSDFTIPIDLISLKRVAGHEQDHADIGALTQLLRLDELGDR